MKERTKRIIVAAAASAVTLGAVAYWLFLSAFSARGTGCYVYIDRDDTPDSVYFKLEQAAAPSQMAGVRMAGILMGYNRPGSVHPGRYETGGGISSLLLMRNLRGGRQVPVRLVIPVVHTMGDLAARLAHHLEPDSAALARAFADTTLLRSLDTDTATVPSLFIPNTYEVYWDITPAQLLSRMKKEHDAFWTPARRAQAAKAQLTPTEVFTLASIVEQESANEAERPLIAGMYLNRLHQGMKLQADPTVKFALRNFGLRRIMHGHLTVDSPYNTYRYEGLPPGPICIPSLNAIRAVLNFAQHDYIYMCAKEDFSGTHNFAVTYQDHLENARKYARALDERNITAQP